MTAHIVIVCHKKYITFMIYGKNMIDLYLTISYTSSNYIAINYLFVINLFTLLKNVNDSLYKLKDLYIRVIITAECQLFVCMKNCENKNLQIKMILLVL